MKDSGVREDDPEFRKVHNALAQLNQQQMAHKAQKEQQQKLMMARQAQAQQQGQNSTANTNGVNGNS